MEGHAGGMMSRGLGQRWGQRGTEDNHSLGRSFHQFLELSETPVLTSLSSTSKPPLPPPLQTCIRLLSYLYQLATGTYAALEMTAGHVGEKREGGGDGETQGDGGGGERLQTVPPTPQTSQTPEDELQGGSRPAAHSTAVVCSETNYRWNCCLLLKRLYQSISISMSIYISLSLFLPPSPFLLLHLPFHLHLPIYLSGFLLGF